MLNIQSFKEKVRRRFLLLHPSLRSSKTIIYLIVGLVVFALIVLGFFIFLAKKNEKLKPPAINEKTLEEIIQDLTAPTATSVSTVSEKVMKSITAPIKEKSPEVPVPENVIQSLTAPSK
ncbi:MAG: hypothetical protein Q7S60_04985 [bacterium]|nr:hypothetical protein [bacterium]